MVSALGWGQTSEGVHRLSDELRVVDLPIVGQHKCRVVQGKQNVDDHEFCTGPADGVHDAYVPGFVRPILSIHACRAVGSWGLGSYASLLLFENFRRSMPAEPLLRRTWDIY